MSKKVNMKVNLAKIPYSELMKGKSDEVFQERMLRAFRAIKEWNSQQSEKSSRVAITNAVFRKLAGGHPQKITEWIEQHRDEIVRHNQNYSMGNAKNPEELITFYNKELGKNQYEKILTDIGQTLGIKVKH